MAIKSQFIVQYDTKQLHLTREWYANASDVDGADGIQRLKTSVGTENDGIGIIRVQCKSVYTKPGVKLQQTLFKSTKSLCVWDGETAT